MNKEDHANPTTLVPVVPDNNSYDDYIGDPQVPEGEPLGNNKPPARPIPTAPPHQQ